MRSIFLFFENKSPFWGTPLFEKALCTLKSERCQENYLPVGKLNHADPKNSREKDSDVRERRSGDRGQKTDNCEQSADESGWQTAWGVDEI
jgi:hypothetical protein